MSGPLPLDLDKPPKTKRSLDRDGSPRPDEERRGRRNDGSKRTRKDDDSESIQPADLLEEVVDSGHHAIEKEKEKQKQLQALGISKGSLVPMQQLGVDMYAFQTGEDPVLIVPGMVPQMDSMASRGWTEPVKEQKKTHFSAKETEILRTAIIDYCKRIGYKEENISEFLFSKKRDLNTGRDGIWPEIGTKPAEHSACRTFLTHPAKCLPHRSVASVYYHAKRKFRQLTRGEWTEADIDELRKCVLQ